MAENGSSVGSDVQHLQMDVNENAEKTNFVYDGDGQKEEFQ